MRAGSRLLRGAPAFARCLLPSAALFASSTTASERCAMLALASAPRQAPVDLEELRAGAERVAHTVFEHMYAAEESGEGLRFLQAVAGEEGARVLAARRAGLRRRLRPGGRDARLVLEQLTINKAAVAAVDLELALDARGRVDHEWMAVEVEFDAMEHVQLLQTAGIDDQRTLRTSFSWTFESEVTREDQREWRIARASPFKEEAAVLRAGPGSLS